MYYCCGVGGLVVKPWGMWLSRYVFVWSYYRDKSVLLVETMDCIVLSLMGNHAEPDVAFLHRHGIMISRII